MDIDKLILEKKYANDTLDKKLIQNIQKSFKTQQ